MPAEHPARYRLTLLGPWDLRGPDGEKVRSVLSQPKRLCLLAYLALSGEPVSRSTLVALFWPEKSEERARNALSQSLHYLRRSLGPQAIESVEGDRVRVAPDRMWFDAREMLRGADAVGAIEPIREGRAFFQGWNADDSQPLQEWLDDVRRRVRERAAEIELEGGPAEDRPGAESASASTPPLRAPRRSLARAAWAGAGLVLGIALTIALRPGLTPRDAIATASGPEASTAGATSAPAVAVLLPRVTVLGVEPALSAEALAEAVHEEIVAGMETLQGVEIVSVGFESEVWQLVRSLRAQGSDQVPEWVVSIGIRSAEAQARVVALLLRGPDYTETGAVSARDYPVPTEADGLLALPREIAAGVVEELGVAVTAAGETRSF